MTLEQAQKAVDDWIKEFGVRYFNELTNMAQLTEEVGEVARIIARRYGEQSEKESDKDKDLGDELADVLFVVICLANVFIDSKSKSIEIEAGEFLKGLQLNNEVTLIDSERIAYFAGFSIQQIMNLSKNIPDNQDWLVIYGKNKLSLPLGYDIYHRVDRKDQAVFFLKKT